VVVNVSKVDLTSQIIKRIDEVRNEYSNFCNDLSKLPKAKEINDPEYYYFLSRFESIIEGLPKIDNAYKRGSDQVKERNYLSHGNQIRLNMIDSILDALKSDISQGYLASIGEIIHADLFADFAEMAEHLLEEGYKDPAAVIIGSVLEEHLRKLCLKNPPLQIDAVDSKGVTKPKKADLLNSELTAASVYGKLDQKSVTAWLDLRNKAAHGQYTEYDKKQVELLLQSVRDFITRHPA
jgi:hypothetical protein